MTTYKNKIPDFAKKKDELEASQKEKDKRIVIDKKRVIIAF